MTGTGTISPMNRGRKVVPPAIETCGNEKREGEASEQYVVKGKLQTAAYNKATNCAKVL